MPSRTGAVWVLSSPSTAGRQMRRDMLKRTAATAEDDLVIVAVDDFAEQVDEKRGQVDVTNGGR
ncbi:hypothetical protein [Actinoplanes sp. NPDC051411]|uniref:hypothetical protein n=1 Tax=Actinoplanes sp. NPDC051411 TaxID=3155522 RepID=UPI0034285194